MLDVGPQAVPSDELQTELQTRLDRPRRSRGFFEFEARRIPGVNLAIALDGTTRRSLGM